MQGERQDMLSEPRALGLATVLGTEKFCIAPVPFRGHSTAENDSPMRSSI